MIENKHITIAHTGDVIPRRIELGYQNENLDAYIYFHVADENLKSYHKYLLATNDCYSEILPIIDDALQVSSALTSISGKWILQVIFCEQALVSLEVNEVLNDKHISLSDEFVGIVTPSKYNMDNVVKPMDVNLQIWYEEVNNNMESLTNSVEKVKGGFDDLKNQVVKDWNENDETSGAYIQNRPMYKTVESVLYEETSGSAFSRNGDFLCYTVHFEGFEFAQGTKCRFIVDDTYVFEGFYNDSRIEYSCGDSVGRIYGNSLEMPYYIYEESGTDKGHNFKVEILVKNIVIEDSYVPILQSDYSVEDKNDSRYIANKVIKEGYAYEVLMKNATFEYEQTGTGTSFGAINGYCLLNDDTMADGDFLVQVNNGVKTYDILMLGGSLGGIATSDELGRILSITMTSDTNYSVGIPNEYYTERNGDVKITVLKQIRDEKVLVKKDGTSIMTPLILDATVDYSLLPYKGDEALQAILDGRQILIKVPNAGTTDGTPYRVRNFMPVIQYQVPNQDNDHLYLFYLKDGLATNLAKVLQGQATFDAVYGELDLPLTKMYTSCPLK